MAAMTEEEKRTRRLAQLSSDSSGGEGATRWINDPSSVAISDVPRNQNKNASVGLNTKKRKLKDIKPSKQNQPKQNQPQDGMLYTLGKTGRQFARGIANKGEQLYEGVTGGIEDVYRGATGKPPEKRSLSSMSEPQMRTAHNKDANQNQNNNNNNNERWRMDVNNLTAEDLGQGASKKRELQKRWDTATGTIADAYGIDKERIGVKDGRVNVRTGNMDVNFADGTPVSERRAFLRDPVHGGTRRMSGIVRPGEESILEKRERLGREEAEQERIANMGLRERIAYRDNQAKLEAQRIRNEGVLGAAELRNQGYLKSAELENETAQQEAYYDAYSANKKDPLSKNQWFDQDRKYQKWAEDKFQTDSLDAGKPTNYMDNDLSQPIDHRMMLYRENMEAATNFYGPPSERMKILLRLNSSPAQWETYASATPEEKRQIINNLMQNKG